MNAIKKHLLECSKLIGSNEFLAYIPDDIDIFDNDNIQEQMYISRLMIENFKKKQGKTPSCSKFVLLAQLK